MTVRPGTESLPRSRSRPQLLRLNTDITNTSSTSTSHIDASNPRDTTKRPHFYKHFEFGVSCKKHPPKRHGLTYSSRNWRKSPTLPPHLAPQTTQQPVSSSRQHCSPLETPVPAGMATCHHRRPRPPKTPQPYSQPPPSPRLPHRDRHPSGPSHERGSSAPPLWTDSHWHGELGPEPLGSSALPQSRQWHHGRQHGNAWKDLPTLPSSYRLSETFGEEQAWSPFSWPKEYGFPDDHSTEHNSTHHSNQGTRVRSRTRSRVTNMNEPTVISLAPTAGPFDREDPARRRELENLSAAMMTVDNGFETQWWYQGRREEMPWQMDSGELFIPPSQAGRQPRAPLQRTPEPTAPVATTYLGWAIAQQPLSSVSDAGEYESYKGYNLMTVSPITEISSPSSSFRPLRRTLTTRSDELFTPIS